MFRKLALTGLTVLGLALPFGLTNTANAAPPIVYQAPVLTYRPPVVYPAPVVTYRPPYYFRTYEVLYRHHHHWHNYGTYRDRYDAERAARHLRWNGYDVRVEVVY